MSIMPIMHKRSLTYGRQCGTIYNTKGMGELRPFRSFGFDCARAVKIKKYLNDGYIVIIAGFQGIDEENNITTLGITDTEMFGSYEFITKCNKNN